MNIHHKEKVFFSIMWLQYFLFLHNILRMWWESRKQYLIFEVIKTQKIFRKMLQMVNYVVVWWINFTFMKIRTIFRWIYQIITKHAIDSKSASKFISYDWSNVYTYIERIRITRFRCRKAFDRALKTIRESIIQFEIPLNYLLVCTVFYALLLYIHIYICKLCSIWYIGVDYGLQVWDWAFTSL